MKFFRKAVLLMLMVAMESTSNAQTVNPEVVSGMLAKMPAGYRVLWGNDGEATLHEAIKLDPIFANEWDICLRSAESMLDSAPVERKLIGRRLLDKSRTALARIVHLGLAYRMTRDPRFAERAKQEMLAVAAFIDWNPSHYLDVGEITAAMAIGLDWCRDALSAEERATIERAIVIKGLEPALAEEHWWIKGTNNWNQVCHAGMILGAISVSDTHRDLSAKIIAQAIDGLPFAMQQYAPDGAYPEGPMYWDYGTSFNVMALHALQVALGTDFGLSDLRGFLKTGQYYLHVTAPDGQFFSYSDARNRSNPTPNASMFYLAARTGDPSLLFFDRQWSLLDKDRPLTPGRYSRTRPFILVWGKPKPSTATPAPSTTHYVGTGVTPIATHRTGWTPDAAFLAIKAGTASANHGHMDAGAFAYDVLGQRWADDLGLQDYESLESKKIGLWQTKQDGQRWQIYRLGPVPHNVLTVDEQLHNVQGKTTIIKSETDRTVVDLSPLYPNELASARRGVRLAPGGAMTLRDEVTANNKPVTVRLSC